MGRSVIEQILSESLAGAPAGPGHDLNLFVDQVLLQDHTGTQAFLALEEMGCSKIACELAVCYSDHNVLQIRPENAEDQVYLESASASMGIWFAKPSTGICHQVHLERFGAPGKVLLGADSHTPTAGALGMFAVGCGGVEAAAAIATGAASVDFPKLFGVELAGELGVASSAKDVALELLRILSCSGGVGFAFEFFGPGVETLTVQQRATIANMCTELGATAGVFPSDWQTKAFLEAMGRGSAYRQISQEGAVSFDEVCRIDLSSVEPMIATPGSPDNVEKVSDVEGVPVKQVFVGTCTNGSYSDLRRFAEILRDGRIPPDVWVFVHPASRQSMQWLAEDGYLSQIVTSGVEICSSTCGACIGAGHIPPPDGVSLRTGNRNFPGRSGRVNDRVYLCSAETAAASALNGRISGPSSSKNSKGLLSAPQLPQSRGLEDEPGLIAPSGSVPQVAAPQIIKSSNISTAARWPAVPNTLSGKLLLKVGDDISTDEIMPASQEALAYRSNIAKISDFVFSRTHPGFSNRARDLGGGWVVAGNNYGQGSSREHAAAAPRFLGVVGVIAKSFARIHRKNLVNHGVLPLTFVDDQDYSLLEMGDELSAENLRDTADNGILVLRNRTRGFEFRVELSVSSREHSVLMDGGLVNHVVLNQDQRSEGS
jgi:aconitate hydratase